MVGTIEPREGHAQVLSAFEQLWAAGHAVNLAIIGNQGWSADKLAGRLRHHPELGKRLFWLEGISEECLPRVYQASAALLVASEGEGFGLPLLEAAQQGLPIVARDLPVIREVAGEHAFYFSGEDPSRLANALRHWLALKAAGQAPPSLAIPRLTWTESAERLIQVVLQGSWYADWDPRSKGG
jgi:hypothetical protein